MDKFKALLLGFITGAECLDDMERLRVDGAFSEMPMNAANTYGDFLRDFSLLNCKDTSKVLIEQALKLRDKIAPRKKDFILDIDSTPHVQCGKKIEGVEYNYKNLHCLDSIDAYDELGFQYHTEVRPGATYSSNGAVEIIGNISRVMKKRYKEKDYNEIKKYCEG